MSEVRQRLFQSRYTPRLIKQETLSEEAVAELSSYSSVKRMIQKKKKKKKMERRGRSHTKLATLREINVAEELRGTLK